MAQMGASAFDQVPSQVAHHRVHDWCKNAGGVLLPRAPRCARNRSPGQKRLMAADRTAPRRVCAETAAQNQSEPDLHIVSADFTVRQTWATGYMVDVTVVVDVQRSDRRHRRGLRDGWRIGFEVDNGTEVVKAWNCRLEQCGTLCTAVHERFCAPASRTKAVLYFGFEAAPPSPGTSPLMPKTITVDGQVCPVQACYAVDLADCAMDRYFRSPTPSPSASPASSREPSPEREPSPAGDSAARSSASPPPRQRGAPHRMPAKRLITEETVVAPSVREASAARSCSELDDAEDALSVAHTAEFSPNAEHGSYLSSSSSSASSPANLHHSCSRSSPAPVHPPERRSSPEASRCSRAHGGLAGKTPRKRVLPDLDELYAQSRADGDDPRGSKRQHTDDEPVPAPHAGSHAAAGAEGAAEEQGRGCGAAPCRFPKTLEVGYFRRSRALKERKWRHMEYLDACWASREEVIRAHVLRAEGVVLEPNMFPYDCPPGVSHWTLWSKDWLSEREVARFVEEWLGVHMPQAVEWNHDDNMSDGLSINLFHLHVYIRAEA